MSGQLPELDRQCSRCGSSGSQYLPGDAKCDGCGGSGYHLTDAGRELVAFLQRHPPALTRLDERRAGRHPDASAEREGYAPDESGTAEQARRAAAAHGYDAALASFAGQKAMVSRLIADAVHTEGADCKQWYLVQIARELGLTLPTGYRPGIAP